MDTIACDVSYYQRPVDDSYPHRWLIFRSNDGTFRDPNFTRNLRWAKSAVKRGRLTGYTVYYVYRPGVDALAVLRDMVGTPDAHITVMIDVESWGGQIRGDHSTGIGRDAERAATWLGSRRRVLAYANRGDFANLFPRRPSWLRYVVASYGGSQPSMKRMIGWQYTNGQWSVPGLPRSSKPFGRCDHNVFRGHSPAQLATVLGVGSPIPSKGAAPAKPATPKPAPKPTQQSAAAVYVVRPGDTLSSIAARHHTTWQRLRDLNRLPNPNRIQVGQKLRLPAGAKVRDVIRKVTVPKAKRVTVRNGDTLAAIGQRVGVPWRRLAQLNKLRNPNRIYPGQVLRTR